jgi:elongation factor G
MSAWNPADLRSVVLLGHGDAGKTTLADRLLHAAGAVPRAGTVKEGNSVFDFEADEKERGHSISLALAHLEWKGRHVAVIDTPGYPDFIGEAALAVNAADLALVCVSAHAGVLVNTRRTWQLARSLRKAVAVVVTRTDQATGSLREALDRVRASFGERCLPWRGPAAAGDWAEKWTEAVVEADDEVLMKYLEGGAVTSEELQAVERKAVLARKVFPVLFTSVERGEGLTELLDFIAEVGPSPVEAKRRVAAKGADFAAGEWMAALPDAPFLGMVWKVQIDRHVGKLAHVRVIQGTLKVGDTVVNMRADKKERCNHIYRAQGREHPSVDAAGPGQLVILSKMDSLHVGDLLSQHAGDLRVEMAPMPTPLYSLAVEPKARGDEARISEALARLADETPTFQPHREAATHELVVSGMSQLHLDLMLRRVRERYGVEVVTRKPRIPYREYVTGNAEGHYRHKKQTGGRGQFAEVFLSVGPGDPGQGLQWSWDIFGGSIPRNFEPAIEKGVREKMAQGVVAGYPMLDVKVSIRDGKYHDVDSSEAAFKIAGGRAFTNAVQKARPIVLEPVMRLEIHIPSQFMGDVSGDLNTRRGRIIGMDQDGDEQVIVAEMPLAEASEYARALTSITSGEGTFAMRFSHYDPVPGQVQAQLVQAYRPHGDDE